MKQQYVMRGTNHEAPITLFRILQFSANKQHFTQIVHVSSQNVAARLPSKREFSTEVMRPSVISLLYIRCLRKAARFCKRLVAYLVSPCCYCQLQEIKNLKTLYGLRRFDGPKLRGTRPTGSKVGLVKKRHTMA